MKYTSILCHFLVAANRKTKKFDLKMVKVAKMAHNNAKILLKWSIDWVICPLGAAQRLQFDICKATQNYNTLNQQPHIAQTPWTPSSSVYLLHDDSANQLKTYDFCFAFLNNNNIRLENVRSNFVNDISIFALSIRPKLRPNRIKGLAKPMLISTSHSKILETPSRKTK